jgi:hypothetical protein
LAGLLTGPANPAVGQNTYPAAGPLPLAPNTRYHVVAQVSSGTGEYNWSTTNSFNQTGSWTMADNEAFSSDMGATWAFDVGVLQMSASATLTTPAVCTAATPAAVPTLNEWALALLSILIVGAAFIRRIV